MKLYLVDGYNFVFRLGLKRKFSLQKQREAFIKSFSDYVANHNMHVALIFDGKDLPEGSYTRGNWGEVELIYTHKGLSADDYIVERLEVATKPGLITVVTSDRGLGMKAKQHGSDVMSVEDFMGFLIKKERKKHPTAEKPQYAEKGFHFDRLLRIFEEKLKE